MEREALLLTPDYSSLMSFDPIHRNISDCLDTVTTIDKFLAEDVYCQDPGRTVWLVMSILLSTSFERDFIIQFWLRAVSACKHLLGAVGFK